jgi:hypothetical protein
VTRVIPGVITGVLPRSVAKPARFSILSDSVGGLFINGIVEDGVHVNVQE